MLGHYKRVLVIGAHPDDEDTELLTVLARSMGAEAAYLSLNRGEGGQNLDRTRTGRGARLLRTEELLAARRLDGARQFFTRAYDFGFSKTLDDTWAHWPRDTILKDVVRVVRRFRPQVIVTVFSGTPRDGHGQHQAAAGRRGGVQAAGDSTAFPELAARRAGAMDAAQAVPEHALRHCRHDADAGGWGDRPRGGQAYHQIAMAGRSLHRSQDMGSSSPSAPAWYAWPWSRMRPARAPSGSGPASTRHWARCAVGGRHEDAGIPAARRQLPRAKLAAPSAR